MVRKKKPDGGRKIAPQKPEKLIKLFQGLGYEIRRQSGSHVVLIHDKQPLPITIPKHSGDVQPEIIQGLIKRAGISRSKYFKLL